MKKKKKKKRYHLPYRNKDDIDIDSTLSCHAEIQLVNVVSET